MIIDVEVDKLKSELEAVFGDAPLNIEGVSAETVTSIVGSKEFAEYLRDQTYREILTNYFVNAIFYGHIDQQSFAAYKERLNTFDGREALVSAILLQNLEGAATLPHYERAAPITESSSGDNVAQIHSVKDHAC